MRLLYVSMIALMTLAAPAFAGPEESDAPNPFTEPSAGQTTTSGLVSSGDRSAQQPDAPGGDQQQRQDSEGNGSDSLYQAQKKDEDGH